MVSLELPDADIDRLTAPTGYRHGILVGTSSTPPAISTEGIDQRLERSSVHQTRGTRETFVRHHRPPVGSPHGLREGL
jgi:hypothetical protein